MLTHTWTLTVGYLLTYTWILTLAYSHLDSWVLADLHLDTVVPVVLVVAVVAVVPVILVVLVVPISAHLIYAISFYCHTLSLHLLICSLSLYLPTSSRLFVNASTSAILHLQTLRLHLLLFSFPGHPSTSSRSFFEIELSEVKEPRLRDQHDQKVE